MTHHAGVGNGARIAARARTGQREAGNLFAPRQTRQVVLLLLLGSVVQQQLRRAQGVGHHHGDRRRHAAAGDLHHHRRVGLRRKPLAAEFTRDDQAEKAFGADVTPGGGAQIVIDLGNAPVVDQTAQLLHRTIQKRLFLVRQAWRIGIQQRVPTRFAAKQFALPPHIAPLQRLLFGRREFGHGATEQRHNRRAHQSASQRRGQQQAQPDADDNHQRHQPSVHDFSLL
ncbi:hypothetical protein MAIT1_00740 [Magnetofaba australis IT-1]|uniref:Uncharacterized protein n=1 Tax=Magnetofaba australis IT-1 TaxID=1434232 RepID=A0A1Y2K241_9PROT|nr:hypothetical protein MAIT1_00740 [Magnetofaba australis IT-1]